MQTGVPLGPYLMGPRLAVGGMGEVYLAVKTGLGAFQKPLALKLLLPHLSEDPNAVEMFLHEARLAARMSHPNVVQIFDVGVEGQSYFLSMELVRGVSLSTLFRGLARSQARLSAAVWTFVAKALLDGLHHAHEQRGPDGESLAVVHRDVTPQNVLVSVDGEVKLTDFGVAKILGAAPLTRPGLIKGKFEYMAPEQATGAELDRRADVFGAGATLFQAATLTSAFRRDNDARTLRAVEKEDAPDLRALRPDFPDDVARALERALAKAPQDRFPSARAFRDALPAVDADAAQAELAALVRAACSEELSQLEERTRQVQALRTATRALSTGSGTKRALRRGVALGLLGAAAVIAATGAVGWTARRWRSAPPAQPPPVAVTPPPPAPTPAPPEAPPLKAATPRAAPQREAKPAAKKAAPRAGFLTVDALPWAYVSVNGKRIGETPLAGYPVEAGEVSVLLENPETGKVVTRRVKVTGGKRSYVKADLR